MRCGRQAQGIGPTSDGDDPSAFWDVDQAGADADHGHLEGRPRFADRFVIASLCFPAFARAETTDSMAAPLAVLPGRHEMARYTGRETTPPAGAAHYRLDDRSHERRGYAPPSGHGSEVVRKP
ncbi:hypothetical protein GCM10017567_75980 [Amycolatopsis bullii]|uniref:Uncharacterized protein n=1 Tax=Amycolatopsis bullii TaxID=941987 RepID=A0ABQ3KSV5_9PSEU|nr:hypothetical protein GCM10017567_75980 [Amycolatopsis bullii]